MNRTYESNPFNDFTEVHDVVWIERALQRSHYSGEHDNGAEMLI